MGEPSKFVIIDEKPKRGQEKRKRQSPSKIWLGLMGFMTLTLLCGIGLVCYMASTARNDCCIDSWDVTWIVATNRRVEELLTATYTRMEQTATAMGIDVNQFLATQIISDAAQTRSAIGQHTPLTPTQRATATSTP